MNIGETLKSMRLHAGLTQTEMAAGIVSESYYSKVERGVHDISADALFKILIKHHLDPVSFFMKMSYRKKNNNLLGDFTEIEFAQSKKDLNELNKVEAQLNKKYSEGWPARLKFQLEMARAWITHSNKDIDPEIKRKAKQVVLEDKMDREMFYYLSQACVLLDIKDASRLFDLAVKAYNKNPEIDVMSVTYIALLCINFLNCCYHKNGEKKYIELAINTVLQLPAEPHIAYHKILAVYYRALFNKDYQKAATMIEIFTEAGVVSNVADTLPIEE